MSASAAARAAKNKPAATKTAESKVTPIKKLAAASKPASTPTASTTKTTPRTVTELSPQKPVRVPRSGSAKQKRDELTKIGVTVIRVPKPVVEAVAADKTKQHAGLRDVCAKAKAEGDGSVWVDVDRSMLSSLRAISQQTADKATGGARMSALAKIRRIDAILGK